jgi:hypothetical protein
VPQFRVTLGGGDTAAYEALKAVNLKGSNLRRLGDEIQVIVTASDPDRARSRVGQVLPEGDYSIERVERVSDWPEQR